MKAPALLSEFAVSLQFTCPKCEQKLTLTASKPGDWIDCPGCEATVQIPGSAPVLVRAGAPARPTPPARTPAAPAEPDPISERAPARSFWSDKRVQFGALAGS